MDFGGLADKAKQWAEDNPDKADGFVDKGSDAVKGRFEGHDQHVDAAGQRAKDYLHGGHGAEGEHPAPEPPPQDGRP